MQLRSMLLRFLFQNSKKKKKMLLEFQIGLVSVADDLAKVSLNASFMKVL